MKIFFDGSRTAPETYTAVRTYEQLQKVVMDHEIDILSLDDGLGPDQPNMHDSLQQLIDRTPEFLKTFMKFDSTQTTLLAEIICTVCYPRLKNRALLTRK